MSQKYNSSSPYNSGNHTLKEIKRGENSFIIAVFSSIIIFYIISHFIVTVQPVDVLTDDHNNGYVEQLNTKYVYETEEDKDIATREDWVSMGLSLILGALVGICYRIISSICYNYKYFTHKFPSHSKKEIKIDLYKFYKNRFKQKRFFF
jgi:hypothetical protein